VHNSSPAPGPNGGRVERGGTDESAGSAPGADGGEGGQSVQWGGSAEGATNQRANWEGESGWSPGDH